MPPPINRELNREGLANEISTLASELQLLRARDRRRQSLFGVIKKLGAEHDLDRLLDHVLEKIKETTEADRCSLFLVDQDTGGLWSKIAHGTKDTIRLEIGQGLVGECAQTCQPILIHDAYEDSRFNAEVDKESGYRTRSILCVPMLDNRDACVGVIQALNKTRGRNFSSDDRELLFALGGVTAVIMQNAVLHGDIHALLEGFIKASVYAIEARDPTTSGHSERVAILCEAMAEALNETPPPGYEEVHFSEAEIRELRYAALLHDFGKVGVREDVLIKANKLYPDQRAILRVRFEYAHSRCSCRYLEQKNELLSQNGSTPEVQTALDELNRDEALEHQELESMWGFVQRCNEPTVLDEGSFDRLQEIASIMIDHRDGSSSPLLTPDEVTSLSIRKGSLTPMEHKQIQEHVIYSWRFLREIPWTRDLQHIPTIAYKHHEHLNGRGYPRGLGPQHIPVQVRIMTLVDIYDALTASDRPYKAAIPHDKAITILRAEAKREVIDQDLLDLFVQCRVFERLPDFRVSSETP